MTKDKNARIHRIYGIILSALLIIAGICLMVACVDIYKSGDKPFSREAVAAHFSAIAIPIYLCLAAIFGGAVLQLLWPAESKKPRIIKQYDMILDRLYDKTDLEACDISVVREIGALARGRHVHSRIFAGVLALAAISFLMYALNGSNFHRTDINASMINAMVVLLPCLVITFGYAVFITYYIRASLEKEIALVKKAAADYPRKTPAPALTATDAGADASPSISMGATETVPISVSDTSKASKSGDTSALVLRLVVLGIGALLLIYGFATGGVADVMTKAVNICTECIGLG